MIPTKNLLVFDGRTYVASTALRIPVPEQEKILETVTILSPSPNPCKDLQIYLTESYW